MGTPRYARGVTQGDAAEPDAERDDATLVVPPGVPLRVVDWLLPPLLFALLVVSLAWFIPIASVKPYLTTTACLVVITVTVQCVFGFRAYTRWEEADIAWHRRSMTATLAALAAFALPFVHGISSAWLFGGTGLRIAADPARAIGLVQSRLSARAWVRVEIVAIAVAVVAILAQPIATAFGFALPALILMAAGSLAAGFAHRFQALG
jgi:hypothetical protein